jgi:hypothetical protein
MRRAIFVLLLLAFARFGLANDCGWEIVVKRGAPESLTMKFDAHPGAISDEEKTSAREQIAAWRQDAGDVQVTVISRCETGDAAAAMAAARELTGAQSVSWQMSGVTIPEAGETTPILQVLASTDPEFRPSREEFLGGPGGFDRSGYFKLAVRGAIDVCTDGVLAAVHEWQRRLGGKVALVKVEQEPRRLFVAALAPQEKGLFRLTYRIAAALDRFDLTMVYVDASGRTLAIEAIEPLFPTFQLDRLMTALEGATVCKDGSTQSSR